MFLAFIFIQTPLEYKALYDATRNGDYSDYHGYAYDGIWVMALAINHVIKMFEKENNLDAFFDFKYDDQKMLDHFSKAMNETNFPGVTVSFFFYCYSFFLLPYSFLFVWCVILDIERLRLKFHLPPPMCVLLLVLPPPLLLFSSSPPSSLFSLHLRLVLLFLLLLPLLLIHHLLPFLLLRILLLLLLLLVVVAVVLVVSIFLLILVVLLVILYQDPNKIKKCFQIMITTMHTIHYFIVCRGNRRN